MLEKILSIFIENLIKALFGSATAKTITFLSTITTMVVIIYFGGTAWIDSRIEKHPYIASSHVALTKQLKDTRKAVAGTQKECGLSCYVSQISLEASYISQYETDYIMNYSMVYGYDLEIEEVRDVISGNVMYDKKEFAGDSSKIIDEINSTSTRCQTYRISDFIERGLVDTVRRFKRLHVLIDRVTACVGRDRYNNISWMVMITFLNGKQSQCGSCIKEGNELRNSIEDIWNH